MKNMKSNAITLIVVIGILATACSGKKEGGGSATATVKVQTAAGSNGKNYTLDKDTDYKYDLIKIDGNDYVVIQGYNQPEAFKKADTITLKIPNKIEGYMVGAIEESAFGIGRHENVISITIPDTVIKIGRNAFESVSKITSIKLPKNLKELGSGAFDGCTNLSGSIAIPDGVTVIPPNAFFWTKITEVILPNSVTLIAQNAFERCNELTSVKLPSGTITFVERESLSWPKTVGGQILEVGNVIKDSDGTQKKLLRKVNDDVDNDSWYWEKPDNDAFKDCSKLSLAVRKTIEDSGYKGKF